MKIVCDACSARYFVSDDKIHKRAVRMTCQKCGHVIVARRDDAHASAAAELRARLGLGPADAAATPAAPAHETADWYYSRDGQSHGPFGRSVLRERFASGELGAECYVWHRELGTWSPAHSTEPYASAIAALHAPPPAPVNPLAALAGAVPAPVAQASAPAASLQGLRARLDSIDDLDAARAAAPAEDRDDPPLLDESLVTVDDDSESSSSSDGGEEDGAQVAASLEGIDLDFDGASRVIDVASMHRALEREGLATAAPAVDLDIDGASIRGSRDDLPAPEAAAPAVDLDIDGASRVVSLADIMRQSGRSFPPTADTLPDPEQPASGDLELAGSLGSERSMIIHIDHLRKQNQRSRWLVVAAVVAVLGLGVGVWFLTRDLGTELTTRERIDPGRALSARAGAEIDAAEFERLAPLADFSLVEAGSDELEDAADDELRDPEPAEDEPASAADERPREGSSSQGRRSERRIGSELTADLDTSAPSLADLEVGDGAADGGGAALADASLRLGAPEDGATLKDGSGTSLALGSSRRGSRRERVDLSEQAETELGAELDDRRGSKYAGGVKASERNLFVSGLKQVSKSVMDCQRRQVEREGALRAKKVYLRLTVEPSGSVSRVDIDKKVRGTYFATCIEDVRGTWDFATFDGNAVELRQGFVLE